MYNEFRKQTSAVGITTSLCGVSFYKILILFLCFAVTTIYLSHKAALTQPSLLRLAFNFHAATAAYLTHIATAGSKSSQFTPVTFPLSTSANSELSALPEFLAENVQEFMLFVHRFKDQLFEVNLSFLPFGCKKPR